MAGCQVTSEVTGDIADADVQRIAFIPLGDGDWKAQVTANIEVDGAVLSMTKEFLAVPQAAKDWLNATGLPLAKTGMKNAL